MVDSTMIQQFPSFNAFQQGGPPPVVSWSSFPQWNCRYDISTINHRYCMLLHVKLHWFAPVQKWQVASEIPSEIPWRITIIAAKTYGSFMIFPFLCWYPLKIYRWIFFSSFRKSQSIFAGWELGVPGHCWSATRCWSATCHPEYIGFWNMARFLESSMATMSL